MEAALSQREDYYQRLEAARINGYGSDDNSVSEDVSESDNERRARRLEERRAESQRLRSKNSLNKLKGAAPSLNLLSYIDPATDWALVLAFGIAMLKDLLDGVGLGSLPVIGTVITVISSLTAAGAMLLTGANKGNGAIERAVRKYGILVIGSLIEMLFGLNFIPAESITVGIIIYFTLVDRKAAEKGS